MGHAVELCDMGERRILRSTIQATIYTTLDIFQQSTKMSIFVPISLENVI